MYTGSWMEGVDTVNKLVEILADSTGTDGAMRVFNILCPYKKPLPEFTGEEEAMGRFWG
jgi:hypothetical protein